MTAVDTLSRSEHLAAGLHVFLSRHSRAALAVLTLTMAWMGVVYADAKLFWHDEIYTVEIARLPSVSGIWGAARDGVDLMPPLNTILTHGLGQLVPLTETTARVPALIGYLTFVAALFEIVRRRSNTVVGISAALMAYFSIAFSLSYTARGYGLMLGCSALALFAWSEAALGRRRRLFLPMLSVAVGAAIWAHYFAVLLLAPIGAGEAARLLRSRRIDWGIGLSLAAAGLMLIPLVPLLRVAAADSATYWHRAHWTDIGTTYHLLAGFLIGKTFLVLWAAVAAACAFAWTARQKRPGCSLPVHEVAAGITAMAIPVLGVALGVLVTGAFLPRYAIAGVIGLCLVVPLAVWWAGRGGGVTELILCLGLTAQFGLAAYATLWHPPVRHDPVQERPLLMSLLQGPAPVAVTGVAYLECWYYAPPHVRSQMVYVTDQAAALRLDGSDTLDRNYSALRSLAPIHVEDYGAFTSVHPAFRVYVEGEFGWLPAKLTEDGALVTRTGHDGEASTYDVAVARQ